MCVQAGIWLRPESRLARLVRLASPGVARCERLTPRLQRPDVLRPKCQFVFLMPGAPGAPGAPGTNNLFC
jgi:hypothetical protein